jgi:putative inorganic carbon (hco3(-)) transporter
MLRIVELGLGATVWVTALAFGGTYAPLLCVAQLLILGLGVLILLSELRSPLNLTQAPRIVPLVLVALLLLQILPLPASLAPLLGAQDGVFPGRPYFTLSFAPYQTVSYLLLLVTYVTAFGLTLMISGDAGARRRFLYVLLALGAFEALYGLVQYLTGWQQIFTYVKKYYLEDATGTYINHNHFAGLLEMVLPFAVAFAMQRLRALRRATCHCQARWRAIFCAAELAPVVFMAGLCMIILTALVFSRSRMGLISAVVSLVMVLACSTAHFSSYEHRPILLTPLVLAVIGIVLWIGSAPVVSRFAELGSEYSRARENRFFIWSDTLRLIRQHPLLGTGLGTFSVAYPSVQTAFLTYRVDHAHCDYLEIATDVGVIGAALIFGSIVWVFVQVVQRATRAEASGDDVVQIGCIGSIAAILVHSLTDFNLYIPANALVFVVVIALAWSMLHSDAPQFQQRRFRPTDVGLAC